MAFSRILNVSVLVASALVALASFRFLALDLSLAFPEFGAHIINRKFVLMTHIVAAPFALLAGMVQFLPEFRQASLGRHRILGRIYVLAVGMGSVSGLLLGINALGGPLAGAGFFLLAVLWMGTTANAVRHALAKNISTHREWMIRSFALTFAAVTLRAYLPFFFMSGMSYTQASVFLAWLCWIPNLMLAELWIARRKRVTT
ncbi:MAG TPA: DUF2306 domain-containing protein [Devosia sp.]|nr:DUF2306 domain-containing protein [Devosia sp.]